MHRFFVAPDILAPISAALPPQVTTSDAGSGRVIEDAPEGQLYVALPEKIAHQVRDVLHLGMGEQVLLLDNSGDEFLAAIVKSGRAGVEVQVRERRRGKSESPVRIVLCQGLLKSARFEWLLEKGTELGVAVFGPMSWCRAELVGVLGAVVGACRPWAGGRAASAAVAPGPEGEVGGWARRKSGVSSMICDANLLMSPLCFCQELVTALRSRCPA